MSDDICEDLRWVVARLSSAKPRAIYCFDTRPPVLLFTDAACEGSDLDAVTFGAILFDKTGENNIYIYIYIFFFKAFFQLSGLGMEAVWESDKL